MGYPGYFSCHGLLKMCTWPILTYFTTSTSNCKSKRKKSRLFPGFGGIYKPISPSTQLLKTTPLGIVHNLGQSGGGDFFCTRQSCSGVISLENFQPCFTQHTYNPFVGRTQIKLMISHCCLNVSILLLPSYI